MLRSFVIEYRPIVVIHSPFKDVRGTRSSEVYSEYAEGLKDLEGFSHVIPLYRFHLVEG